MIERILEIHNVGKLETVVGGKESLGPLTLIYAENAHGKTTLASILRSWTTGDPTPILERRTLGSKGECRVSILYNGRQLRFKDGMWEDNCPELEVFDEHFINNNVYQGESVQHTNKRNLLTLILGQEGVELQKQVDRLDQEGRGASRELTNAGSRLQHLIGENMDIDEFVTLKPIPCLELRINEQQRQLAASQDAEAVQNQDSLSALQTPVFPLEDLHAVLARGLDHIEAQAEQRVRTHIHHCLDPDGESWLAQGVKYEASNPDECPFCGQQLTAGMELIAAYRQYFSDAYTLFKKKLQTDIAGLKSRLAGNPFPALREVSLRNRNLWEEFWSKYLPDLALPPCPDLDAYEETWVRASALYGQLLDKKLTSPLDNLTSQDVAATVAPGDLNSPQNDEYNEAIENINKGIAQMRKTVSQLSPSDEEEKLRHLLTVQRRFQTEVDEACTEYTKCKTKHDEISNSKELAKQKLQDYTSQVMAEYQETINGYLVRLGADFKLHKIQEQFVGGKPSVEYRLLIRGTSVKLTSSNPEPSFKNTLSSGDKSTLAFAFFLAGLVRDPQLASKIVVFDDPVSSLDRHRKRQTRREILTLQRQVNQVIVLSHDPHFLGDVFEGLRDPSTMACCLSLRRSKTGSSLQPWDLEELKDDYFRNYDVLVEYRNGLWSGNLDDIVRYLRVYLEGTLRYRFYPKFGPKEFLSNMIARIRDAELNSPLAAMKEHADELSDINDFCNESTLHFPMITRTESLTDNELKSYVERALNLFES